MVPIFSFLLVPSLFLNWLFVCFLLPPLPKGAQLNKLKEHTLALIKHCLTFDFIGTSLDDAADDSGTVQIPSNWRTIFEDPPTLQLFWDSYKQFEPGFANQVMECLVQLSSVRRSLFQNETTRNAYLGRMMIGTKNVMATQQGMNYVQNYHELCRLLARLKSTYQLAEMISCDVYTEWLDVVANFTLNSLRSWQWSPNSVQYLLNFWSKMITSTHYTSKTSHSVRLESYTPQLTQVYVSSRLKCVEELLQNDSLEDPLDDEDSVMIELELVANIARCMYAETSTFLLQMFDPLALQYQQRVQQGAIRDPITKKQLEMLEGQITWLIYVIAKVIGGRGQYQTADEYDLIDGELSSKVLAFVNLNEMWVTQFPTLGNEKLNLAFLQFFQQFRKVYIGEQTQRASKVYTRLQERLGLADQNMVLEIFVRKLAANLKFWVKNEIIIQKTLEEFNVLTSGYSSVRLMAKLDTVQFLLTNFMNEHFAFLSSSQHSVHRTTFCASLSKLLFTADENLEEKFEEFVKPIGVRMDQLLAINSIEDFRQDSVKVAIIGLFRDLRGIASACLNKKTYMLFFEWIHPKYSPLTLRALEALYDVPAVTTPVLKFFAELVQNKSQRLQFDISSADGILLFRETSQVLVTYGSRIVTLQTTEQTKYASKLKGISVCFNILKYALSGHYVNYGVFALYGDKALENALGVFIKMLTSISLGDLMSFPKLSRSYFGLLEYFIQEHIQSIKDLSHDAFFYILATLSEGLRSPDVSVASQVCAILDHLCTFIYKNSLKFPNAPQLLHPITRLVNDRPELLQYLLSSLYSMILYEDSQIQWSVSRPMLPLILLCEKFFTEFNLRLVQCQQQDKREWLAKALDELMVEVERKITPKNRDRFTQNVTVFRRDINGVSVQALPPITNPFAPLL